MKSMHRLKVSVSGVRGVVGEKLQPSLAADFAASFGGFIGRGSVIVGRDTRPSGPMFEHAVTAGLLASGCSVILGGILPTPTLQFAVRERGAAGAIAITASHNPVEWNALKFINQDAMFLSETEMDALLDVCNQPADGFVPEREYRSVAETDGLFELHAKKIYENIDVSAIRDAKLRVAADCCNGVGAVYTKRFLKNLGVEEIIALNDEPDGVFRHSPEPVADNLSALSAAVRENRCDAGFAQDPDGDRIFLVDENGVPLGEQRSILIPAMRVLERTPGDVSANIQTTAALGDLARKAGGKIIYTRVGEVNVANSIRLHNSVFGAEGGSGGVMWPAVLPCRDSFSAMALTLEKLALSKKSVSALMETLPKYYSAGAKLECPARPAEESLRALARKYESYRPELIDGVRIELGRAWVLARQSNTEPVIRIYAESTVSAADADALAASFRNELEASLDEVS